MINKSVYQGHVGIRSVHAPTNNAAKYMKQKLIEHKGEIDKSTIIGRNFNSFSN